VVTDRAAALGHGDFASRVRPSGVPELDQAADALNQTASRLGELLARERAFAADVSHQLNTPLTSLRLALESALITPGTDLVASIELAVSEVERLQSTVTTLLALARDGETGDVTSDVATVCTAVTQRFVGPLAAVDRPLRVDLDPALPPVRCSPEVLSEIVAVLVDNACVHGAGVVTVSGRRAGSGVVVDVEDEGAGITGDTTEVFRRRSPDAAGHGIGLALARSLAEAHGARLELARARPRPVFSVALPGDRAPHD
jgi:signal transduction histidine kinase